MKLRRLVWLILLALLVSARVSQGNRTRWILLPARRSGVIEAADPATLRTIGGIRTGSMTDWVSAQGDGRTLLVAFPKPPESQVCCELYSLDLESSRMFPLVFPAMRSVASSDGFQLFTQRGVPSAKRPLVPQA